MLLDSLSLPRAATGLRRWPLEVLRRVADALMPPRCPGCAEPTQRAGLLCAACWSQLPRIGRPRCVQCAVPLPPSMPGETRCFGCTARPPAWQTARAPFAYGGPARSLVLRFKHGGEELAGLLAREMTFELDDWPEAAGALVVPVPLHRGRLWRRGYNQSLLLARRVADGRGLGLLVDALVRQRATRPSHGLSRAGRRRNVAGAFAVRSSARPLVRGASVLLVDDVLTTGATADACARALRRAGAASVQLLVATRVVPVGADSVQLPAGDVHG